MHQGRWKIFILRLVTLIGMSISLTACLNIATTGVQAIYNHRNLQQKFNDNYISLKIEQQIQADINLKDVNISVSTFQGKVLLAGQVPDPKQRLQIEKFAKFLPGVKHVYNFLQTAKSVTVLKNISDIWITAKIKSQLIASNEVDVNDIKILTENGTVYLMGTLFKDEADAAIAIARETTGVEKVIKIFTYLQIVPELTL